HRYFQDLDTHKELNADRVKLLEHVLTDAYFTGLKDAIDPDPAPPAKKKPATGTPATGMPPTATGDVGMPPRPPGLGRGVVPRGTGMGVRGADDEEPPLLLQRRKRERLNIKAQATAWALYYYLAQARSSELKEYIAELNKLPRDLPIDGKTAFDAFV